MQQELLNVLSAGTDPELAVSQDGRWLFVANEDAAQTSVIDATNGTIHATIKVGGEPEGVDLRPDGKVVYVTSEQDNQIAVIDAVARAIRPFPGPRPRSTGFLPDSSRAYISAENGSAVVVADAVAHRVIETIPLAGEMVRPMGIAPSPMGNMFLSRPAAASRHHRCPVERCRRRCRSRRASVGHHRVAGWKDDLHRQRTVKRCVVRRWPASHAVIAKVSRRSPLGRRVSALPNSAGNGSWRNGAKLRKWRHGKTKRMEVVELLGGLLLATAALHAAQAVRHSSTRQESTPRQSGFASRRPCALSRQVRRLSWARRHRVSRTDLTTVLGGMADERLFQTIRKGVPGTEMAEAARQ